MKKYNVVADLRKIATLKASKELEESNIKLDDIQSVLDKDKSIEDDMLKHFGTFEVAEKLSKTKNVSEKVLLSKGNTVSGADVETICNKYLLQVRSTSDYIKPIPAKVLSDMRRYEIELQKQNRRDIMGEKKVVSVSSMEMYRYQPCLDKERLFIIAPKSHFNASKPVVDDPVVLYRVDKAATWPDERLTRRDQFEIVSTFGNDFTLNRIIKAWVSQHIVLLIFLIFNVALVPTVYVDLLRHNDVYSATFAYVVIDAFIYIALSVIKVVINFDSAYYMID